MLTKRIIPCLDVDHGRVVKGKNFKEIRDVDDPVRLARRYSAEGADELVFYDITASYEERDIFLNIVEQIAKEINIPFAIGGGIRTVEDFRSVCWREPMLRQGGGNQTAALQDVANAWQPMRRALH